MSGLYLVFAIIDTLIGVDEYGQSPMGMFMGLMWLWAFVDAIVQCTLLPGLEVRRGFFIGKVVADSLFVALPFFQISLFWFVWSASDEGYQSTYRIVNLLYLVLLLNLGLDVNALMISCKQPLAPPRPQPGAPGAVGVQVIGQPVVGQPVIGQPGLPQPVIVQTAGNAKVV